MYKADVTPVVGLPQFNGWSQVASSYTDSGQLVYAFAIRGDHAGNVGRDLTSKITAAQISSTNELHRFVTDLITEAKQLDVQLQLACGFFTQDQVVLTTHGGCVFLKRQDRSGVLLSSVDEIKLLEGKRRPGDIVVLITQQAEGFVSEIEQKFQSGFETDSVVTSIIPGLHGRDDSSLSSIAFVTGGQTYSKQKSVVKTTAVEDSAKTQPDPEQVLDIPPALKLRGAGKKRHRPNLTQPAQMDEASEEPSLDQAESVPQEVEFEATFAQDLSNLGENTQSATPSFLAAILAAIGTGIGSFFHWLKNQWQRFNWSKLISRLVQWASNFKQVALQLGKKIILVSKRVFSRDVYLNLRHPRRTLRLVLPIAAGVLVIGGLVGFKLHQVNQQVRAAQTELAPLTDQLTAAREQASSEPISARASVDEVIAQLEQLEQNFANQKRAQKKITQELNTARELYTQISGQEEFAQLEIFYDLRLVDGEFVTSGVDATQTQALFLDRDKKQAIVLDLANKQAQKIDLSQLGAVVDLELTDQTLTLLSQGVRQKELGAEGDPAEVIAEGDSNRAATLIETFASYIYVFNPEKRNIYRYAKQEEGYSDPIGWVSGAAGFDFDQATSWAIDGEVWVATREGGLHRLATGREQEFAVTGLSQEFNHSLQVFTHEDLANLYVLEPDAHRLVVLTKEGEFLKEITSDSLASTTTLLVSEELGKAFAVSGSIVYGMEL